MITIEVNVELITKNLSWSFDSSGVDVTLIIISLLNEGGTRRAFRYEIANRKSYRFLLYFYLIWLDKWSDIKLISIRYTH